MLIAEEGMAGNSGTLWNGEVDCKSEKWPQILIRRGAVKSAAVKSDGTGNITIRDTTPNANGIS